MKHWSSLLLPAWLLSSIGLPAQIAARDPSKDATAAAKASPHPGIDRGLGASGYEILSKTNGTDLEFYADRVLVDVRKKWYPLIPQAEQASVNQRGTAVVEFTVKKDGSLGKIAVTDPPHETAMDAAAFEGIKSAEPLGPLPAKYHQKSLNLRHHFAYNQEPGPLRPG